MRCVDEPGRSLRLFRLAVLASISVAAVSCSSDTHRFESTIRFDSQGPGALERGDRLGPATACRDPERAAAAAAQRFGAGNAAGRTGTAGGSKAWRPMSRRRPAAVTAARQARLELGGRHRHHGAEGRHHRRPGEALWRSGLRDRRGQQHSERHGAASRPAAGHSEIRGDRQHARRARRRTRRIRRRRRSPRPRPAAASTSTSSRPARR